MSQIGDNLTQAVVIMITNPVVPMFPLPFIIDQKLEHGVVTRTWRQIQTAVMGCKKLLQAPPVVQFQKRPKWPHDSKHDQPAHV